MTDTQVPTWTLGDRLRKAREKAGVTQIEMAKHLGLNPSTVGDYERGANVKRASLVAWSIRCDVALWWLTGEAEPDAVTLGYSQAELDFLLDGELVAA